MEQEILQKLSELQSDISTLKIWVGVIGAIVSILVLDNVLSKIVAFKTGGWLRTIKASYKFGHFDVVKKVTEKKKKSRPRCPDVWYWNARANAELKNCEETKKSLETLIMIDPGYREDWMEYYLCEEDANKASERNAEHAPRAQHPSS